MVHTSLIEQNGFVFFYPDLFGRAEADRLYADLLSQIKWQQDHLKIYGKDVPLPRLTAWYGEKQYTYSGIEMQPRSWTEALLQIKSCIEPLSNTRFNSVLLNLYRDGNDSVSWHSDDEPELGKNPIIGSVSFGATRRFSLKHRRNRDLKRIDIELTHGSFLLMAGETQHHWLHQIPKTKKITSPRINLTFRMIH
ncbi:alpha-ketoglutarate-dependent dioxygenase AlkB [Pseudanabaenaceae cyanobacterium LEGE 13415]|nr:alpha-ketoglutarate-dependent dioxygenase AlkB [Pseudanabaenaceae cyanobacterium LEGE 13415]